MAIRSEGVVKTAGKRRHGGFSPGNTSEFSEKAGICLQIPAEQSNSWTVLCRKNSDGRRLRWTAEKETGRKENYLSK
jgi:hypothetical protein